MSAIREQAYQDYADGMKYADIAAKYDISLSTVKSWATRYWKTEKVATDATKEKKVATSANKKLQPDSHKKGGQPGNTNAITHGAYRKVFDDFIGDNEKLILANMSKEPEHLYLDELELYTVRERWILQRMHDLKSNGDSLVLESTRSRKLEIRYTDEKNQLQTEAIVDKKSKSDELNKLEAELTKVQAGKIKTVSELAKITKEENEPNNAVAVVDDWISAVLENE